MTQGPTIVRQVISLAKLPGARRRREVERELREHLEDMAEEARSRGYDEALSERMASTRFGDLMPNIVRLSDNTIPRIFAAEALGGAEIFVNASEAGDYLELHPATIQRFAREGRIHGTGFAGLVSCHSLSRTGRLGLRFKQQPCRKEPR
ncbi:MAG: permease prefix domain 1-containing protein [Terracidiphilus sp.]|jgi:hypothetical protein